MPGIRMGQCSRLLLLCGFFILSPFSTLSIPLRLEWNKDRKERGRMLPSDYLLLIRGVEFLGATLISPQDI